MESEFEARVLERTGHRLADMPRLPAKYVLGGHIMCRRGNMFVVTVGYPDYEEEDGTPIYSEFGIVDLGNETSVLLVEHTPEDISGIPTR